MPGGNKTGPSGLGAMTGRAAGYCGGYPVPGFANLTHGSGRGYGSGRGRGRAFRRWSRAYPPANPYAYIPTCTYTSRTYPTTLPSPQSPEKELVTLQEYKKGIEAEKNSIEQEVSDLENRIRELKTKVEQGKSKQ